MKHFTYLAFLLLALGACKKGDLKVPVTGKPCADTTQHNIVSVNGPTSANVNEQVTFTVNWKGLNACDNFISFKQDTAANTIFIKAIARQDSCSVCVLNGSNFKAASYKFQAAKPGIYYLKFFRSADNAIAAITDMVVVN